MNKPHKVLRLAAAVVPLLAVGACGYLAPKHHAPGPGVKGDAVEFRYFAPTARRVQLAGSWPGNNWTRGDGIAGEANVGLMSDENGDGVWELLVPLPPGRYKYLFLVDENTWHLDPGSPEEVPGGPVGVCSQIILYSRGDKLEIR